MAESEVSGKSKKSLIVKLHKNNVFLFLLIISFILFILTRNIIFAVLTGVFLISIFVVDIAAGVKRHGITKEIKEIVIAVIIAIAIWEGLIFALGTTSPVSAIVSCSMLPRYERGDLIILKGVGDFSKVNAPEVEISTQEFFEIYGVQHPACGKIGVINYKCSGCRKLSVETGQQVQEGTCVNEIEIKGKTISTNYSNDVIVYVPQPHDPRVCLGLGGICGEIIHRVYVKIKVADHYYFLTKGDNNPYFDSYYFNPVSEENVKGRVLIRIPYIGYLKLFISGLFQEPVGCESVLESAKMSYEG